MNGILWSLLLLMAAPSATGEEPLDVVIRGGSVYDGSGAPPQSADVGLRGDRVAAIGNLASAPSRRRRSAS